MDNAAANIIARLSAKTTQLALDMTDTKSSAYNLHLLEIRDRLLTLSEIVLQLEESRGLEYYPCCGDYGHDFDCQDYSA